MEGKQGKEIWNDLLSLEESEKEKERTCCGFLTDNLYKRAAYKLRNAFILDDITLYFFEIIILVSYL